MPCSAGHGLPACTADLGGHSFTDEFTNAVIEAVRNKLELWGSLGMS